jgi:DNA-binding IclR family transcriptional regulator
MARKVSAQDIVQEEEGAPVREDSQRSIQSVELGFRLIRCLEESSGPLTLKELSARASMTASKAHLYLVSFRRVGLVQQEADSGRYTLGTYALQLGLSALRKLDVARLAREPLRQLSEETGEGAYLAVWGNRGPCIVLCVNGPRPMPMSLQVGYVLPTITSATGRIFFSYLPRAVTADIVGVEQVELVRDNDYGEPALLRIAEETRARSLSRTDSLLNIGFTALSAPVFAYDGSLAAAITVIGPSSGMEASLSGRAAKRLSAIARGLSAQMGWSTAE